MLARTTSATSTRRRWAHEKIGARKVGAALLWVLVLFPGVASAAGAEPDPGVLKVGDPADPVLSTKFQYQGAPFFLLMRSSFNLIDNPDYRSYVDAAAEHGYTGLRIWMAGEGRGHVIPERGGGAVLSERIRNLAAVLGYLRDAGMVAEITLFNGESFTGGYFDTTRFGPRAQVFVWQLLFVLNQGNCEVYPNFMLEIANEPQLDRDWPSRRFLEEGMRFIRSLDRCGRPLTPGDGDFEDLAPDYAVRHHVADGKWPFVLYPETVGMRPPHGPVVQDENTPPENPSNPASFDPDAHRFAFWTTAFAGGYYTYSTTNGICTHPFFDGDSNDCGEVCDGRSPPGGAVGDDDGTCEERDGDLDYCQPGEADCVSFVPALGEEFTLTLSAFFRTIGSGDLVPADNPFDPLSGPNDFVSACGGSGSGLCFGMRSLDRPVFLVYAWAATPGRDGAPAAATLDLPAGLYTASLFSPGAPSAPPIAPRNLQPLPGGGAGLLVHAGGRVSIELNGLVPDALLAVKGF